MAGHSLKRRGLTLLEMLVCGLLISCVLLGVAGLFAGSARAMQHQARQQQAALVAEEILEQQRADGFAALQPGGRDFPAVQADQVEYRARLEVLDAPGTSPQLLKRLRVTVTWKIRGHEQQLVRESWLCAIKN